MCLPCFKFGISQDANSGDTCRILSYISVLNIWSVLRNTGIGYNECLAKIKYFMCLHGRPWPMLELCFLRINIAHHSGFPK